MTKGRNASILSDRLSKDWESCLIFDSQDIILAHGKFEAASILFQDEVKPLISLMRSKSRDEAIKQGIQIHGIHYDIHNVVFEAGENPKLIYGRYGIGDANGIGIGLAEFQCGEEGEYLMYVMITYIYPVISSLAISQLIEFCKTAL